MLSFRQKIIITNALGYYLKTWYRKPLTFDLLLPVLSGENWKNLDGNGVETLKDIRNAGKKLIIVLIVRQKIMVTNTLSWLLNL